VISVCPLLIWKQKFYSHHQHSVDAVGVSAQMKMAGISCIYIIVRREFKCESVPVYQIFLQWTWRQSLSWYTLMWTNTSIEWSCFTHT